ncbi:hypothetical protein QMK17_24110 [Rhodococcus sp. G-MC3]|uniref:hypothetical protein n=1 Tax=Rhodococcus sp. G-MC3 TaxID=3046209 RepID=UPI0024BAFA16|nr:hypothetical protein [Rhodococcus sp. G-MC3]MDJ0396395.1 hypothetical protein [Rhodococcus sp. G-MC3]
MSDSRDVTTPECGVGDTVQLRVGRGVVVTGTVVEDFGDFLVPADKLGRDWAAPHRWAVAVEGGTLVFADDDDILAVTEQACPRWQRTLVEGGAELIGAPPRFWVADPTPRVCTTHPTSHR